MEQIDLSFIKRHLNKYPLMEAIDVYKLLYQDTYLVGHLINDNNYKQVKNYLDKEIELVNELRKANDLKEFIPLYQYISSYVVRVNLLPFSLLVNDFDSLFDLFIKTSKVIINKEEKDLELKEKIKSLELINYQLTNDLKIRIKQSDIPSHSDRYRQNYFPHYRVIKADYLFLDWKVLMFQSFIDFVRCEEKITIIALEGKCGSGKTTITSRLKNCTVIAIDDHFDGKDNEYFNVSYVKELLKSLKVGTNIKEKCYDCHNGSYYYKEKEVKNVVICEGVYSYIDSLRDCYDYLGYVVSNKEVQKERILKRSNHKDYFDKWIIRENKYYQTFDFIEKADILI